MKHGKNHQFCQVFSVPQGLLHAKRLLASMRTVRNLAQVEEIFDLPRPPGVSAMVVPRRGRATLAATLRSCPGSVHGTERRGCIRGRVYSASEAGFHEAILWVRACATCRGEALLA